MIGEDFVLIITIFSILTIINFFNLFSKNNIFITLINFISKLKFNSTQTKLSDRIVIFLTSIFILLALMYENFNKINLENISYLTVIVYFTLLIILFYIGIKIQDFLVTKNNSDFEIFFTNFQSRIKFYFIFLIIIQIFMVIPRMKNALSFNEWLSLFPITVIIPIIFIILFELFKNRIKNILKKN